MWTMKSMWLGVALVLTPVSAWAQTPEPSLRYQVVDVAADDRLNVREQPGVEAGVVGALAPEAENIVITGSTMDVNGSDWWEIVFVEGYIDRGWVNGRFLEPVREPERERDYPLQCGGTEPFWSLDVEEGQATYSTPDEETLAMAASGWRKASGRIGVFAVQLERDGQLGYAGVWRERDHCSDGMSDIRYPFGTIVIRPDGEVLAGCCRRSR
jgi:uncharacterized membrane protein